MQFEVKAQSGPTTYQKHPTGLNDYAPQFQEKFIGCEHSILTYGEATYQNSLYSCTERFTIQVSKWR